MNILYIKHFFVGFMVSEIQRVSVFGHCPYSVTFPYVLIVYLAYWFSTSRTAITDYTCRYNGERGCGDRATIT